MRRASTGPSRIAVRTFAGYAAVAIGTIAAAIGSTAWLTALGGASATATLAGVLLLGILPVAVGLTLISVGLGAIGEGAHELSRRAVLDGELVAAVGHGATAAVVALRLARPQREIEPRLDALVARDVLALELSEGGELVYRAYRYSRVHSVR